ncbi:DUF2834 domain-containing protein [Leptolyngbya sp. AN02str]|uniref:DUF2834 domain-containing protein n=1 Tax=Leptolyngbya sp. AN02str TaxID=3423363 RepID=UPI003D315115
MVQAVYLILCVVGAALPYSQFIPFLVEHGANLSLFLQYLFANRISSFFGWDVVISAMALLVFAAIEGRRLQMRNLWIYGVATLLVGVSFGLPLFLWMRERQLALTTNSAISYSSIQEA